jgi:hypothetical protein
VQEEVNVSQEDLRKIIATLQTLGPKPQFSQFAVQATHPYFIFKNHELIYWSDSRFVPEYEKIRGTYTARSFEIDRNKFVVNHGQTGEYEIFSLIELFRLYESRPII